MYFFKYIGLGACFLVITASALPLNLAETVCKPCFQDQILKHMLISLRYPEQTVVASVLPSAEIGIPPTRHSSPATVDTAVKNSFKLPESEKECINVLLPGVVKMYKNERALSLKAIASHRLTLPTNDTSNPLAMYDLDFGVSLLLPMTKASHAGPKLKNLSPQEKCVASLLPAIMVVSMQHEARVKGTLCLHTRDHTPLTSQQEADIASINALYPELQRFLREDEEKKQRQHGSHARDGLTRQQASDINTLETLYPGLTHGMTEGEAKKEITAFEALFPHLLLVASPKEDIQHFEDMHPVQLCITDASGNATVADSAAIAETKPCIHYKDQSIVFPGSSKEDVRTLLPGIIKSFNSIQFVAKREAIALPMPDSEHSEFGYPGYAVHKHPSTDPLVSYNSSKVVLSGTAAEYLGQELPEETNMYVTTHAYPPPLLFSNHRLTFRTSHVSSSSSSSSSSSPQSTILPGSIAETKPKRQMVINSMDFKGGCMLNAECHKWVQDHCHDFKKRQDTLPTFAEYKHFCMRDVKCTQWIAKHCVV